jgi:hypothetical protein
MDLNYVHILPQANPWFQETSLESLVKPRAELHVEQTLQQTDVIPTQTRSTTFSLNS